jgi:hypothetical protein
VTLIMAWLFNLVVRDHREASRWTPLNGDHVDDDGRVLAPIVVFVWQVHGRRLTLQAVEGERASGLGLVDYARLRRARRQRAAPSRGYRFSGGRRRASDRRFVLFEWARRTVAVQFFSWIFSPDTPSVSVHEWSVTPTFGIRSTPAIS